MARLNILTAWLIGILMMVSLPGYAQLPQWQPLGKGLHKNNFELLEHDGALYSCGNGISKWEGGTWADLPTIPGVPTVQSIAFFNDTLYAGGYYSNIYRLEDSTWVQVGGDVKGQRIIRDVYADEFGVIVRGSFDSIGTAAFSGAAEWNGHAWQPVRAGLTGSIRDLELHNDELLASGNLDWASNTGPPASLVKWNGVDWEPFFSNGELQAAGRIVSHLAGLLITSATVDTGGTLLNGLVNWKDGMFYSISSADTFRPVNFTVVDGEVYGYGLHHPSVNTWDYHVARFENGHWIQVGDFFDGYAIDIMNYQNTVVISGSFANCGTINTGNVAQLGWSVGQDDVVRPVMEWAMYPNPTSGQLTIAAPPSQLGELLTVFDLSGSAVRTVRLTSASSQLDLSDLSGGIYFVKVFDGVQKLVITH